MVVVHSATKGLAAMTLAISRFTWSIVGSTPSNTWPTQTSRQT
jgi:hypothetical protein